MDVGMENKLQHQCSRPKRLELHYLRAITEQFSEDRILGSGGFGIVYKGVKEDGKLVAVKKLTNMEGMDDKQFLNEAEHLMDLSHLNIVKLEGYCYHIEKEVMTHKGSQVWVEVVCSRLLCFEYMSNGSLDKHLSDESSGLDWHERYNIIEGICKGLHYLHEGRRGVPILHLDLKPSNILLDKNMVPKIADFGLSKLFGDEKTHTCTTNLAGTCSYVVEQSKEVEPADWHEALDIVELGFPGQSVKGMAVICRNLTQAADPESTVLEDLMKEADRLVLCLSVMVTGTFNSSLSGTSKCRKYALNTLIQTFQIKRLAHAIKEGTLENIMTELVFWLLDERVLMDDGKQLLNALILAILENAQRTSSFIVLINLLRPLCPSKWRPTTSSEPLAVKNLKFSDIVVKCLIKLTKVLQSTIDEVDIDRILQSIHIYLQELGIEEVRIRAGADDKQLRMVKTVLHELVRLRGAAIKGHLSLVPTDAEPRPIILGYIDIDLQILAVAAAGG